MTPEQAQTYVGHLKKLGKIIHSRMNDEIRRALFIDAFPGLGEIEMLSEIRETLEDLGNRMDSVSLRDPLESESIIRELRELEYTLQTARYEAERDNDSYYDIAIARHLAKRGKWDPENTTVPIESWHDSRLPDSQLPDTAGIGIGGKRKKTRRGKRRLKKKTRKQR